MLLLLLLVLGGSLLVQAELQPQSALSREGIACIAQSREETALGRWLQCLQPSSSEDLQDHELPAMDTERKENSQIEPFMMDKEIVHEKSAVNDELPQVKQLTVNQGNMLTEGNLPGDGVQDKGGGIVISPPTAIHFQVAKKSSSSQLSSAVDDGLPQVKQLTVNRGNMPTEGSLPGESVQDKGGGIDVSPLTAMHFEVAEKSSSSQFEADELRSMGDDALLHWLKLNMGILAFGKLFFSFIRRYNQKKGNKRYSGPDEPTCSADDTTASEIRKGVGVSDASSKKGFESAHLHVIGSSLGSAVGAVFSEVLLRTSNSGFPVPSEKISMLLESALKELSIVVADDDGCSRLVADFITAFKSTYSTMYRIQQACSLYDGSGEINLQSQTDNGFSKATGEKQNTNDEITHASRTGLSDDSWQVKQGVPFNSSPNKSTGKNLESRSVPAVDMMSLQAKNLGSVADHGEFDSGALGTSFVATCDSASGRTIEKAKLNCGRQEIPAFVENTDGLELTASNNSAKFTEKCLIDTDYEVDDASSLCEEPPSLMPRLDLMVHSEVTGGSKFQTDFLKMYERSVRAQEQHNQIKFVKLSHSMKQHIFEEEKIQLAIVANSLMRENIDLDRLKANFKENRVLEQQAKEAYVGFSTTCADELAAGLLVMLATLVYSVRKYSFTLLNDLVSTCQISTKEPRRSWGIHVDWFHNSLDSLAAKFQAFVCQVSVTGRISVGLILVGVVASVLLRRSVTTSSQAMPATILIIVLGGVCGYIGKISVDSLGGSGNQWWVVWGAFCFLHALSNCFTPSVYRLLHGSPTNRKTRFGLPFWIRRFTFHVMLVLVLPVLAGLLPFGSFCLVMNDFYLTLAATLSSGMYSFYGWRVQML